MKSNKIHKKLEEFVDIYKFANTKQRKDFVNQEVRVFLMKYSPSVTDWQNYYKKYKEMLK